jgi:hypothetical protein
MTVRRPSAKRAAVALVCGLALMLLGGSQAALAAPDDVTFEGESMSLPSNDGTNNFDANASGNQTKAIWTNGTATKTVTTTRSTVHLFVRARGDWCQGDPTISVKVDGHEWYAGPVSTSGNSLQASSYKWIGVRVSIPSGSHAVSVGQTNNYDLWVGSTKVCDRSVYIDKLTLVATPFSPTGWRNTPLADNAPIAANSSLLRDELIDQINDSLALGSGPAAAGVWVNTDQWSVPVYTVPPDQPTVAVTPNPQRADLAAQWSAVPLPPDAKPAAPANGDRALLVWQPSTDTLWEFWLFSRDASGKASAAYGGRMTNVSQQEGHFTDPPTGPGAGFGTNATSIAELAGLQRIEEIRRGVIDHAIDFQVATPRGRAGWCWPAQRTDGYLTSKDPAAIPGGTRFRFPASFDLDAYAADPAHPLHRYALMVAKAIQKYGMVADNSAGVVSFVAEDPTPTGSNPYGSFWDNKYPNAQPNGLFANFPWSQLQVVQPGGFGCVDKP